MDSSPQLVGALKGLGFRDSEIRLALRRCERTLGVHAKREQILRCALQTLADRAVQTA